MDRCDQQWFRNPIENRTLLRNMFITMFLSLVLSTVETVGVIQAQARGADYYLQQLHDYERPLFMYASDFQDTCTRLFFMCGGLSNVVTFGLTLFHVVRAYRHVNQDMLMVSPTTERLRAQFTRALLIQVSRSSCVFLIFHKKFSLFCIQYF